MPDGSGVNNGVGTLDEGLGALSGIIEYTMIRAKDAYQIKQIRRSFVDQRHRKRTDSPVS